MSEIDGLMGDVDDIIEGKSTPAYKMTDSVARDSAIIQSKQELATCVHQDFPPKLAFEYALNSESHASLRDRYNISEEKFKALQEYPAFQAYVASFKKDIAEFGLGFRMRARVHAESALEIAMDMAKSEDTPHLVRANLLSKIVQWADQEPVQKKAEVDTTTVNIQINI